MDQSKSSNTNNCLFCGKSYTRKLSCDRHVILCEVLYKTKTKREKICDKEETTDIPTTKQLYNIIQELAVKYSKMETKMEEMQKWVDKKKKKINVIEWLNANIIPQMTFTEWTKSFIINEEHIQILIEQNMIATVALIFDKNLQNLQIVPYPIQCFVQKPNLFYIYEEDRKWVQYTATDFIILFRKIHSKILSALIDWYNKNLVKINNSDKMSEVYNKTLIKLMSANFTIEYTSKIRINLYNYLKKDMKTIMEYEFE